MWVLLNVRLLLQRVLLGDESGYEAGEVQKMKLAVIEAEWHTEPPPAGFNILAMPDQEKGENSYAVKIPYALGIIATRSLSEPVKGIHDLVAENEQRIRQGKAAYGLFQKLRQGTATEADKQAFEQIKGDLGYGLILLQYTSHVIDATEEQIKLAAKVTVPPVAPLFWAFRIMVAAGFTMLVVFALSFYFTAKRTAWNKRWLLRLALFSIPLPWIAVETGWFVAEYGRQPWAIGEILPTFMGTSTLSAGDLMGSIFGFVTLYTVLLVIELYLMIKFARLGPSSLHTGRYHFEKQAGGGGHVAHAYAQKLNDRV